MPARLLSFVITAAAGRAGEYLAVVDLLARLTVLGSLNMDISVTVPTLPTPGATVLGGAATFAPGGKGANQAVAAARLGTEAGIQVRMVGCVGDDGFGRTLRMNLSEQGVNDESVRTVAGVPTGIAMITVDEAGENMITVAPGANREVGTQEIAALTAVGESVLVISAEVPVPAILAALSASSAPPGTTVPAGPGSMSDTVGRGVPPIPAATRSPDAPPQAGSRGTGSTDGPGSSGNGPPARRPLTVLNLAPAPSQPEALDILRRRPDWLVVNEPEAAAVLGRPVSGLAEAARAAAGLVAAGARSAVVTAGAAGAAYHCGSETSPGTVPGFTVHARDTVGAGDTFVGALAVALAAGIHPAEAVTAASAAAATAVTRPGTQAGMPRPADLRAVAGYEWPVRTAGEP